MMLFPQRRDPETGSRMPSISTGGAATKAVMKQMVAASKVGIISTPNQPTYRRLLVEVTQSQKLFHEDWPCCLERVVAIVFNRKVRPSGKWWSYYFLSPLREDMKDVFIHPRGLGLRGVVQRIKKCKLSCVVDVFILLRFSSPVNPQMGIPIWGLYSKEHFIWP